MHFGRWELPKESRIRCENNRTVVSFVLTPMQFKNALRTTMASILFKRDGDIFRWIDPLKTEDLNGKYGLRKNTQSIFRTSSGCVVVVSFQVSKASKVNHLKNPNKHKRRGETNQIFTQKYQTKKVPTKIKHKKPYIKQIKLNLLCTHLKIHTYKKAKDNYSRPTHSDFRIFK